MAKPGRIFITVALVATVAVAITAIGISRLRGPTGAVTGPEVTSEDPPIHRVGQTAELGVAKPAAPKSPSVQDGHAAQQSLIFKTYHADLCYFATARLRSLRPESEARAFSLAEKRALRTCARALAQSEPAAPGLDKALRDVQTLLSASKSSDAADKLDRQSRADDDNPAATELSTAWRRLGTALGAWRKEDAANAAETSTAGEAEKLARACMEKARVLVEDIARANEPTVTTLDPAACSDFRASVLALARYGTSHPPDGWTTVVEPALELLLRQLEPQSGVAARGGASGPATTAEVLRVFLTLIEANQRVQSSAETL